MGESLRPRSLNSGMSRWANPRACRWILFPTVTLQAPSSRSLTGESFFRATFKRGTSYSHRRRGESEIGQQQRRAKVRDGGHGSIAGSEVAHGTGHPGEDITVRFGDFTAVDNVSITVDRGEVFGFLGPERFRQDRTLIKALCGLLKVSSSWAAF